MDGEKRAGEEGADGGCDACRMELITTLSCFLYGCTTGNPTGIFHSTGCSVAQMARAQLFKMRRVGVRRREVMRVRWVREEEREEADEEEGGAGGEQ